MVQRGRSTTSENDANEPYDNSILPPSSRVKVKAEKVKREDVKKGKQRESRRALDDDSDDHDESEDDPDEEEEELANGADPEVNEEDEEDVEDVEDASPRSRKRVRVDDEGGSRQVKGEPSRRTRIKTLPRGEDG